MLRPSARGLAAAWLAPLLVVGIVCGCARYRPIPLDPNQKAISLDSRSLTNIGLRSFLAINSPSAVTAWPPASWDFDALTWVAFYYHPSLDIARAQWGVTQAAIKTAGEHPNPILTVTPGYNTSA